MKIKRGFYIRDGISVARDLLGKILVKRYNNKLLKGRIVETAAYLGPEDRGSLAYGGRKTRRTEAMYSTGGRSYVYLIYGMYHCFNVVTNREGVPHAVLIRAVEPVEGIEEMEKLRGVKGRYALSSGPGKLCKALGITIDDNNVDIVLSDDIWIEDDGYIPERIAETRRVGIDYAGEYRDKVWRYYIEGNPWVSKKNKNKM